jgi:hypothetical protein
LSSTRESACIEENEAIGRRFLHLVIATTARNAGRSSGRWAMVGASTSGFLDDGGLEVVSATDGMAFLIEDEDRVS